MKYNLNFETLLILCFISIIIYCILRHFKHMENFYSESGDKIKNEQITPEIEKQVNKLFEISRNPGYLIDYYSPHNDILKKYEDNTRNIINNQKDTVKKHTEQKLNDLQQLEDTIKSLEDYAKTDFLSKKNSENIKIIKSHNNGNELSVELTQKVNDDPYVKREYLVKLNNGCLKVDRNNDYNVVPCNKDDNSQKFNIEYVYNDNGYKNKLDPTFSRLDNLNNVHYPFSLVKAKSNGNCLKQVHGKISVEPCREYEGQRWAGLKKDKFCK